MSKKNKLNKTPDINIFKYFRELDDKEKIRQNKYGKVKKIINTQIKNNRYVAVGDEILYSDKWRTFPDFLTYYIWHVIGKEWFDIEIKKHPSKQHYIMKWWKSSCELTNKAKRQKDGLIRVIPNGAHKAFIQLAYDLYILNHHQLLQKHLIHRIKNYKNFQGARYELFAISTMIKAGFEIKFEDETDRSKKHVELIAKHPNFSENFAIEAKSKHRKGVLGFLDSNPTEKSFRLKIVRLINNAASKQPNFPLIIFVDLNLPPNKIIKTINDESLSAFTKSIDNVKQSQEGKDIFNIIFLTNHPYYYGREDEINPKLDLSYIISQNPAQIIKNNNVLDLIIKAVSQYENIPNDFPIS